MEGPRTEIAQADVIPPHVIAEQVNGCQHEGEGSQTEVNNTSNSWVIQVEKRFHSQQYKKRQPSTDVCIYRVPNAFMDGNREAYVPKVVSFGPFHHNKHKKLSAMEDLKLEAINRTLERLKDKSIEELIREVQNSDKKIRDCYEDSAIEYEAKTLAWMMTMDACFILEFLRAVRGGEQHVSLVFKSLHGRNAAWHEIFMDILKLENQIPLFLLINILQLEFQTSEKATSFLYGLLCDFPEFKGYPFFELKKIHNISGVARHLLDLCRKVTTDFLIEANPHQSYSDTTDENEVGNPGVCIPKAELPHKAGIQFKRSVDGKVGLEKTRFVGSTLYLPPIFVDDKTETVLRNLIAFEECHGFDKEHIFSHYIILMGNLINTEKDVALLTKEEIIVNFVGSEEFVPKMFNRVSHGIVVGEDNLLTKVAKDLRKRYNTRMTRPIDITITRLNQFIEEHPWYIVSIVAAMLIFSMTAIQTVYSVKKK